MLPPHVAGSEKTWVLEEKLLAVLFECMRENDSKSERREALAVATV